MSRPMLVALILVVMAAESCSKYSRERRADVPTPTSDDPFVGFFAHPSSGAVELRAVGDGQDRGSMWGDFGPFPVEGTRDGDTIRGTVTYGGSARPFELERTAQGMVLTADGSRAQAPLQRYRDQRAFEGWFSAQGGYRAEIEVEEPKEE